MVVPQASGGGGVRFAECVEPAPSQPLGNVARVNADEKLRQARAETVVVLSPNTELPGDEAELELYTWRNAGIATYVVGWRRAQEHETARGWRGAWSGDLAELDGRGEPWWWRKDQAYGMPAAQVAPERMLEPTRPA